MAGEARDGVCKERHLSTWQISGLPSTELRKRASTTKF